MIPIKPLSPKGWPTASQRLLLRASVLQGEPAISAWKRWQASHDVGSVDSASFHILPQLYLNLRQLEILQPALGTLQGLYKYFWSKNQLATRAATDVLRSFQEAHIPAIMLNGLPLALFHYSDVGARSMNDTALLIRAPDLFAAARVLEGSGHRLMGLLPPKQFLPFVHAVPYVHSSGIELELHWRPFMVDCPHEPEERFWQRTLRRRVDGVIAGVPDATDLLMMACFHGRKPDPQSACRWVLDAMTLTNGAESSIEWDALLERARDAGLLLPVRDALTYLYGEYDAMIPASFMEAAWEVAVSAEDDARYHQLTRSSYDARISRIVANNVSVHYWRYVGGCRARNRRASTLGFALYFLFACQQILNVPSRWRVPFHILRAVARRFRLRGPRCRSPSPPK